MPEATYCDGAGMCVKRFATAADRDHPPSEPLPYAVQARDLIRENRALRAKVAAVKALAKELAACPFVDYVSRDELSREHADRLREILRGAS